MNERNQLFFKLIVSHFVLPLITIALSFIFRKDFFLFLTISQTLLIIVLLAGYWEFFGLLVKRLFIVVSEIMILISVWAKLAQENSADNYYHLIILLIVIQVYLLVLLGKIILVIFKPEEENVDIEFPFKNGLYLITDGGNSKTSRLMNYHFHSHLHKKKNTNRSMLFATDIVKLNQLQPNFLFEQNENYPIFSEEIFSPVSGEVIKVVDSIQDNIPFSGNYPYNTGNTVVIKNGTYFLLMGHFKKGSIGVSVGAFVNKGDLIGRVGNSGMSERPHIHMQLIKSESDDYWKGTGINIRYNNRNLYKNRSVKLTLNNEATY